MRRIVIVGAVAGFFAGCSGVRWAGHPDQTGSKALERVSVGGHDQRSHGLPLHAGGSGSASFIMTDSAGSVKVNALLYRQRADQIRSEAATHQEMRKLYTADSEMSAHCDRVISKLIELSLEYDAIARLYETRVGPDVQPPVKEKNR